VKHIFISFDDSHRHAATLPQEAAGICHALRYCDSTVAFNILECYNSDDSLCLPEALSDLVDESRKRDR
jgi:hypothetical protein